MQATNQAPFRLISIEFQWSESGHIPDEGLTVYSVAEADRILRRICATAPKGGGYHKTSIVIRYADPETGQEDSYHGRWDVQADGTDSSILGHYDQIAQFARSERGRRFRAEYPSDAVLQDLAIAFVERGFEDAQQDSVSQARQVLADLSDAEVTALMGVLAYVSQHGNVREREQQVAWSLGERMAGKLRFQAVRLKYATGK